MMDAHWTTTPVLEGQHVRLRPLERTDGPAIVAAADDGRLWDLFYTSIPSAETIEAYLDAADADRAAGRALPFVVVERASERVVGATRYMRMHKADRRLEIGGTFYAQSVQRTAVNTECKLLLLRHAFEAMGCQCVQFRTDHFNQPSQRAIERLGAKRDGVLRGHRIMADGRVRDTVVYSILTHEWEGVRQNLESRLMRAAGA
jgi:RimJ/RimL family protein N-acetyltransferase